METGSATRNQILLRLKKAGPQTVEELADNLDMSSMGIRQHLTVLERDGYITHRQIRRHIGRPKYQFALTPGAETVFPKSYANFATDILSEIESTEGTARVVELIAGRATRHYESQQERVRQPTLTGRIQALTKLLTDDGSLPELTSADGYFQLAIHNCNIIDIAQRYPQACQKEKSEFSKLLGTNVIMESSQASGDFECRFSVKKPAIER